MNNSIRNFSAMSPGHFGNAVEGPVRTHIMLLQIDTLCCQQKELGLKGGQG